MREINLRWKKRPSVTHWSCFSDCIFSILQYNSHTESIFDNYIQSAFVQQDADADGDGRHRPWCHLGKWTKQSLILAHLLHCWNVTSSTKLKVDNIAMLPEDRATGTGNTYRKFGEIWSVFKRYESRQTDTVITIIHTPTRGEVTENNS